MNKAMPVNLPTSIPAFLPGPGGSDDALLDIKAIMAAVRRRLWLIISGFVLTFALVSVILFQQTPIYTSSTRVIVDTRETNVVDVGAVLSGLAPNTAIIDTEVEVIKSTNLLDKVATKLDLEQYAEFNYFLREPSTIDRWQRGALNFI